MYLTIGFARLYYDCKLYLCMYVCMCVVYLKVIYELLYMY